MHPSVHQFGEKLAKQVFDQLDLGSPFVLFTLERRHIYVWDRTGRIGYGREAALTIMGSFVSSEEAAQFFDRHAEDSYRPLGTSDAYVSAYRNGLARGPSKN